MLGPITCNITVAAGGNPPVANDDSGWDYIINTGDVLNIGAPGVLANDSDPGGKPLTAVLGTDAANGDLTLGSDGSFTYSPDAGFDGPDQFTYRAYNGLEFSANAATVYLVVTP